MSDTPPAPDGLTSAIAAIDAWEHPVHAWVRIDIEGARRTAPSDGPLAGLVVGVKDVFDTADLPTEYGSPIYAGHQPSRDAAVVARLRDAGAIVLGKTVTTEFACYEPGPTANPHRLTHTPGGSSSGSAAAVATGMAEVALGTQTAGSVIRPASFCGVLGYKPTYGTAPTAGVKHLAPSLDTVGWFARNVATLDRVRMALTEPADPVPAIDATAPPRIAVLRAEEWHDATDDARAAVEAAAQLAADAGADVTARSLPPSHLGLAAAHPVVMAFEIARSFEWEHREHADALSDVLRSIIEDGATIDPRRRREVLDRAAIARSDVDELFGDRDVLLTLAALGEAPAGLDNTGDPRCARLWTLVGHPTVSVPGLTGSTGLPVGVQLVGRPGRDAELLAAAAWLTSVLPAQRSPSLPT
ncbi:MAG: amidase [Acidimicrobiia bacterium]